MCIRDSLQCAGPGACSRGVETDSPRRTQGLRNLDPDLLEKLAAVDPGNRYGVPYTWGTLGLGMNVEAVKQRLPDVTLNSLDLLFKPEYASKLKDCGIAILDSPQEVIGLALHYLGKNPYSTDKADLSAAEALLHQLQPNVLYVATGRQISDLANGSVCLALTYNCLLYTSPSPRD